MAPIPFTFVSVVKCLLLLLGCSLVGSNNSFKFGLDMIVKSYDSVCWFEALKKFPNTNVGMFNECGGQAKLTMEGEWPKIFGGFDNPILDFFWQGSGNMFGSDLMAQGRSMLMDLKQAFQKSPLVRIPQQYGGNCSHYLLTPLEPPEELEGEALNDAGLDYPYKAFSHCLLNQLRKNYGEVAITAVMNERTHFHKDWLATFLDRDNEFRGLHKSNPFQIDSSLTAQAQEWAEKLAGECKITASMESQRSLNGQTCGENMVSVFTGLLEEIPTAAYAAAASWYEETKDYPWATGFEDGNIKKIDWGLFGKIKEFTQMIWGASKMVGYGYAYNSTCAGLGMQSRFIVARYFPPGNKLGIKGSFKANVQAAGLLGDVLKPVTNLLGGLLG